MEWTPIIITALTSGTIGAVLTFWLGKKKEDRSDFQHIIETWHQDNHRLRQENEMLRERLSMLEKSLIELELRFRELESTQQDLPLPMWLKSTDFRMIACNTAYEEAFLEPKGLTKKDYEGKFDSDVWDEETANTFRENDKKALRMKNPLKKVEMVEGVPWRILKYKRYAGNILLGIAGIAWPIADEEK